MGRGESRSENNVYGDVQVFDSECMRGVDADPQNQSFKKITFNDHQRRWLRLELEASMMEAYLVYHARLRAAPSLGGTALNAPAELPFPVVYSDRVPSLVGAPAVAPRSTFSTLLTSPSSEPAPSPGSGTTGGGIRPRLSAANAPSAHLNSMATLSGAPEAEVKGASAGAVLGGGSSGKKRVQTKLFFPRVGSSQSVTPVDAVKKPSALLCSMGTLQRAPEAAISKALLESKPDEDHVKWAGRR